MNELLETFVGVRESDWMMSTSERLAIVGLLQVLKPARTLEFGYRFGGLTEWLARYSGQVTTVDIDAKVLEAATRFENVLPLHMTTGSAAAGFIARGERFDLTIIDADHSRRGAREDLENALKFSDVILMHDVSNPECRAGYESALKNKDVFARLDLLDGRIQADGLWGGLGMVLPGLARDVSVSFPKSRSTYPLLSRKFHAGFSPVAIKSLLKQMRGWFSKS